HPSRHRQITSQSSAVAASRRHEGHETRQHMNNDEKYQAWKERPFPIEVSSDFSADVMRRVHREARQRQAQWTWPGVLEYFQRNVSLQYALLAVAATAGLSRLWLIFFAILQP